MGHVYKFQSAWHVLMMGNKEGNFYIYTQIIDCAFMVHCLRSKNISTEETKVFSCLYCFLNGRMEKSQWLW